ncbi:hypothetical protein [Leisingera sp. M658]|uniref:hypothetical protein n=1 Tax=Leisingera sp. M658 TaxID=2867015 RepID=UPI0021A6D3DB|nr:hypothetical protein [Leisingera sp. M658]UWQ77440.1 hypothetical protein K3724_22945 [Leisingera sp. M658]
MVRRKRPSIQGTDPEYTSDFAFKPAPTNKAEPAPADDKPDAAPQEPKAAAAEPATRPEAMAEATPKPKRAKQSKPAAPKPKPAPSPKPSTAQASAPGKKRETSLDAAVRADQVKKLEALNAHGLELKDIVTLAGRRAAQSFELKPEFIAKQDVERLPARQGYHTSKRLPAQMLDKLRDKHDPLRLKSDAAMVRGQFEPLFWSCLDEVIDELNKQYGQ